MNNYPVYSTKQKWIHWISAILVLIAIILPLAKRSLSHLVGGQSELFTIHKSLGIIILLITIWRIYIVIKQGVPEVLPKHERFQRILSKTVQGIIYLLLLVLPLSGYLMSGRAIHFLGLISIPNLSLSNNVHGFFKSIHIIGAYLLIALLILHIAAAIYHHVWVKDNVMKSMLPNRWFN